MFTTGKKLVNTMIGLAMLPAAVLVLTGCSASTNPASKPSASASAKALSPVDYSTAYDKCLTALGAGPVHGTDAEGHQTTTSSTATYDPTSPANIACTKKLGPAPAVNFTQSPEMKAKALATAKCLRANGYDVADPNADGISQMPVGVTPEVSAKCGVADPGNSSVQVNGN